jgi:hypothetical protein
VIHMECAVPVRASRGVAWRVLEGKVRDPERHLSRIRACEVEDRGEDELLRRVQFDDGTEVTERVVLVPESEILFQFLEHPKFEGEIRHVLFEAEGGLWLSFLFRGQVRAGGELSREELDQVRDGFARAVRLVAAEAERMEQAGHAALEPT